MGLQGIGRFFCGLLVVAVVSFGTFVYIVPPVLSADLPGVVEEHAPAIKPHTDKGMSELSKGTDAASAEMDKQHAKRSNGPPRG